MTLAEELGYAFQPHDEGNRPEIARSLRRARSALRHTHGGIDAFNVADLLTDLRHLCHTRGVDFENACDNSRGTYRKERGESAAL